MKHNLLNVRNKLSEVGVEVTPEEVWRSCLALAGQNQESALRMLDNISKNKKAFNYFANLLSPEEDLNFIVVREKEYVSKPNPWDLILVAIIGFILGIIITLLFGSNK